MHTIFTLSQVGDLGYKIQHCYQIAKLLLCNEAAARTVSNNRLTIIFNENNTKQSNLTTILTTSSHFYFSNLWNIEHVINNITINCRHWLSLKVKGETSGQEEHRLLNGFASKFHSS